MTQQALPIYETGEEATKAAILNSGKTMQQVGHALWPERSVEAAATLLRNALNPNRDERLTSDQHLFVANFTGDYSWLYYCAHRCGHSQPVPVAPEDEQARLQREFVDAVRALGELQRRLDQNGARLRSVA